MRKFITGLATAATLSLALVPTLGLLAPANAAEPAATISLVGLDLSNPAHAAEFSARVGEAAERVCRQHARANPGGDFTIAGCKVAAHKQAAAQLSKTQRDGLHMAARANPVSLAAR